MLFGKTEVSCGGEELLADAFGCGWNKGLVSVGGVGTAVAAGNGGSTDLIGCPGCRCPRRGHPSLGWLVGGEHEKGSKERLLR